MISSDMDNTKHDLSAETILYRIGVLLLPLGILMGYALLTWILPYLSHSECVVYKALGVYCPGCGGTRAVVALLQGNLLKSAWYHPFVLYTAVMYAWFMLSHTLEKLHIPFVKGMIVQDWVLYGMLVMIALNFVLKNFLKFCFGIVM